MQTIASSASVSLAESNPASEQKCTQCGAKELEYDPSRSNLTCTQCGLVISESDLRNELCFDQSTGASRVMGSFVGEGVSGPAIHLSGRNGFQRRLGREPREDTLRRAKVRITQVASVLRMSTHHIEAAHRLFMLAIQHNFVQGRRTEHVVAACLYVVCRREKTTHLLIDFSDALQINVYKLGRTYLRLVRLLNLRLPLIDPSLYVHRFAALLEFEEKTHLVAVTALRMVARMNRDWMQLGRRPSGICGASLLIAARLHGYKRSKKEIGRVVKVCEATLRRRVDEFLDTPASHLKVSELEKVDEFEGQNPPSYRRARQKEVEEREKDEFEEKVLKVSQKKTHLEEELPSEEANRIDQELRQALKDEQLYAAEQALRSGEKEQPSVEGEMEEEEIESDEEISKLLVNEEQAKRNEKVWNEEYKDYLEEKQKKEEMEQALIAQGIEPESVKRKRRALARKRKREQEKTPEDAAEASLKAVAEHGKKSDRIDHKALERVLKAGSLLGASKSKQIVQLETKSGTEEDQAEDEEEDEDEDEEEEEEMQFSEFQVKRTTAEDEDEDYY